MTAPRRRTSFGPTVVLGLGGSALATVAASQGWATATTRSPGLRTVTAEGADVAPGVLPLALVALAAWGTVLVLRRRGRRAVAVLGFLAALVAGGSALLTGGASAEVATRLLGDAGGVTTETTLWPAAAAVGSFVAAAAFVVAYRSAPVWPEMSARYDAPGGRQARPGPARDAKTMTDAELWRALDEGRDPTASDGRGADPNP
jgi:uncharacterized membrane protein (TIGR02234 family)